MPMSSDWHARMTRNFFDGVAAGWTSRYRSGGDMVERQAQFIAAVRAKVAPPAQILDFGCGSGVIALALSEAGYNLTGCDISSAMIDHARRNDMGGNVNWVQLQAAGTIDTLPFEQGQFDAIVASSVFEYLADFPATLAALVRVIKPGGWLIATVPDLRSPHRRKERWLQRILKFPGLSILLRYSRWAEGAAYLQVSINRRPANWWIQELRALGMTEDAVPPHSHPLLLLSAQKGQSA